MAIKTTLLLVILATVVAAQSSFMPEVEPFNVESSVGSDAGTIVKDIQDAAVVCAKAFLKEIPSTFCWKSPPDGGKIPTACAPGTFRSAALCYDNCNAGYYFWGGVCWEQCPEGYHNDGAICGKDFFHWFFKKSYVPKSYTNFSDKSVCPSGMYKQGALCYTNCDNVGLENCGIGACAANAPGCAKGILSIGIAAAESVEKLVKFVVSIASGTDGAGFATDGLNAINGAIQQGAEKDLDTGLNDLKTLMTNPNFQSEITSKMVDSTISWAAGSSLSKTIITDICAGIADHFLKSSGSAGSAAKTFHWPTSNAPTIIETIKECKTLSTENERILCAKEILNLINEHDPTGITGLVAAFLKPVCYV